MDENLINTYSFGTPKDKWEEGTSKSITFIVTEDCQLRCKYCYIVGKNSFKKLNFETAKKSIDYILENQSLFPENSIIWDFIGGEPFLEIKLIDQICDYLKIRMYELNHKWFYNYRFSFTTNGIQYSNPNVQKYIEKNLAHISITLTLDGTESKHDLNRVYLDGSGSYKDIVKNIPLWQKQFPNTSTKVTFASADLIYLKESILHLWEIGIKNIDANVVAEDVWQEGDDIILENQLTILADEILENKLYSEYSCSLFSKSIGKPNINNANWCGAGKMLAIDTEGKFFPCIRFAKFSLENRHQNNTFTCTSLFLIALSQTQAFEC